MNEGDLNGVDINGVEEPPPPPPVTNSPFNRRRRRGWIPQT